MLLLLYLVVKTKQYIVTLSCMFLDEKTVLEIWLNPGLNLTIFRRTGPRCERVKVMFSFILFVYSSMIRCRLIIDYYLLS